MKMDIMHSICEIALALHSAAEIGQHRKLRVLFVCFEKSCDHYFSHLCINEAILKSILAALLSFTPGC